MVWAGCKVRLVLKAIRATLVHKDLKAFLASVALLVQKVILVIPDHRATKERRAILDHRAIVAPKAHRASKGQLDHKGLREILVIPDRKGQKATKALRAIPVSVVPPAHRANLARTARTPQLPAQQPA